MKLVVFDYNCKEYVLDSGEVIPLENVEFVSGTDVLKLDNSNGRCLEERVKDLVPEGKSPEYFNLMEISWRNYSVNFFSGRVYEVEDEEKCKRQRKLYQEVFERIMST